MAESIAEECSVRVGGILAPGEIFLGEPGADGGAGDFEQRANDAGWGFGQDGREAGGSGSPEEAGKNGFGLIVERVAGGDGVTKAVGDTLSKPGVAAAAGFLLQISFSGGERGGGEGESERLGQIRDEVGVGIGFGAAELVIYVKDDTGQPGLMKDVEEEDGVGAAGNSNAEASCEVGVAGRQVLGIFVQTMGHRGTYFLIMRCGLFALLLAGVAVAQEPVGLSIKVDVSVVNVAFIVRDRAGALNRSLAKDDIEILEDGVKQEVRFFGKSGDQPLRLALAADMSGSQQKFLKQHHRDIERFLESTVTPKDKALLVCFGNHIRVVSEFTSSVGSIMEALDRFQKGYRHFPELEADDSRSGGTALFDSVFLTAGEKLASVTGERKAMILFSDGEDNSSAHDLLDAIEAAQSADSVIYTVRYTESRNGQLPARARYGIREMERLAKETGGVAFDASQKSVGKALGEVAEELRSMYDVGYVSTNPNRDGSFRKVVIRVKQAGATVRSKPGYFARR